MVNADKPHLWKADIARSVDFYNDWFLRFAPRAYRDTRVETTRQVEFALKHTANLTRIEPCVLKENPSVLPILRMATAPPLARDRLIGLSGVAPNIVKSMEEEGRIPPRMSADKVEAELAKIGAIVTRLLDEDIFPWLAGKVPPAGPDVYRAATIVADRLCGAVANPIIRNAQERRQLEAIGQWLGRRGYSLAKPSSGADMESMKPGTFAFRVNVSGNLGDVSKSVNIPVDVVVMPRHAGAGDIPLLIEAKSAGDFTNTNKRRKEEAMKVAQLRSRYGNGIRFVLFLCGYFDTGYLGYEAAEGIDWVWEHRIGDFKSLGV